VNVAHNIPQSTESILVVGLGLTGYSIVRHLHSQGADITVADSRLHPPYLIQVKQEFPDVEIITGQIPVDRFSEFDEVVTSPGLDIGVTADTGAMRLIGDIELFTRSADAPVIGITGSNGKSTVTMLVSEILAGGGFNVKTGGNIGIPALDLLDGEKPDFYVLELSSFQLEATYSLALKSATVLNISEDHMDRYGSLDAYVSAKRRIFDHTESIVVNRDEPRPVAPVGKDIKVISFGLSVPERDCEFGVRVVAGTRCLVFGDSVLAPESELVLQGEQNVSNILAAMALVSAAGVELTKTMIGAAVNYGGLPHRCELVAEYNSVKWINDSKGTNVGATVAALKGFKQSVVLIAGGKGKGANFEQLSREILKSVKYTILIGEDAGKIDRTLDPSSERSIAVTLEDAVLLAMKVADPGNVVLFSPACASFDMFDSYEHRGNVFKQLVMERVH
jgi:UDP-N-acetylmuramoylalanine--D-glutamate ligase